MKYLFFISLSILSCLGGYSQNAYDSVFVLVKDQRTLQLFFNSKGTMCKDLGYAKAISFIILEGRIEKTNFLDKVNKIKEEEWILVLPDGTKIWIGKENSYKINLNKLYKKTVQVAGSLLYGSIDIYKKSNLYAQSRTGYRIDIEEVLQNTGPPVCKHKKELDTLLSFIKPSKENMQRGCGKYGSVPVILEGTINKKKFVTKTSAVADLKWMLIFDDKTEIVLRKKGLSELQLDNKLYNKKVRIKGSLTYDIIVIDQNGQLKIEDIYIIDVENITLK